MSQLGLTLPQPPNEYDPHYERRRNRRIEESMNAKLGRLTPPVFGGVPLGILTGTDATFVVVKLVETTLPFNAISVDNPWLITRPPNPAFDPTFAQVAILLVALRVLTDHSNKSNEVILRVYDENDLVTPIVTQELNLNIPADSNVQFMGIPQVGSETGKLVFTLEHNATSDMTIDMTQSKNSWIQLTINPLFTESNRYGTQTAYDVPQESPSPIGYQAGPGGTGAFPSRFSLLKDYDT